MIRIHLIWRERSCGVFSLADLIQSTEACAMLSTPAPKKPTAKAQSKAGRASLSHRETRDIDFLFSHGKFVAWVVRSSAFLPSEGSFRVEMSLTAVVACDAGKLTSMQSPPSIRGLAARETPWASAIALTMDRLRVVGMAGRACRPLWEVSAVRRYIL